MIEVKNLSKTYGSGKVSVEALKNVNFRIHKSEFVSIIGKSGCGKTTLLRIIAGLLPKNKGEIIINEKAVTRPTLDIGIIFQDPVLLPWRNAVENILLPIEVIGLDIKRNKKKALDLIKLVGLEEFSDKLPDELSGGMAQRVSICRALIYDPSVLLMDEPFGALDALTREIMNVELLKVWKRSKKTILFVTHNISEACFLSDRVIVLTPRPGTVGTIVKIDMPRPRNLEIKHEKRFIELTSKLHHHILKNKL